MKKKKGQYSSKLDRSNRWLGAMFGAFSGYAGAEAFLRSQPHPLHWVTAVVVALFGYGGLALWQYRKYKG